jgi:phosphoglycerate dehydrogenase-like enzyme
MKIYVAVTGLAPEHKQRLNAALAGQEVQYAGDFPDENARKLAVQRSEIVFGNVSADWLAQAPNLKWVQLDSAGFNAYLKLATKEKPAPFVITNLNDFYGVAVAEAAIAGLLAFQRQLPALLAAQREKKWMKKQVEPAILQLSRSKVIILGAGAIGKALVQILRGFECSIEVFARTSPLATLKSIAALDAAIGSADIVINSLPEVPETVGILGRERIGRMRSNAIVVNVGRGSAVDEKALVEALDAHRLAAAILDVTQVEPLPVESPLWTHPHVVLTQHTGGRFPAETDGKIDRFLANYARFSRGEPLPDPVNLRRGY